MSPLSHVTAHWVIGVSHGKRTARHRRARPNQCSLPDPTGATNYPLWTDHRCGTRAPAYWPRFVHPNVMPAQAGLHFDAATRVA